MDIQLKCKKSEKETVKTLKQYDIAKVYAKRHRVEEDIVTEQIEMLMENDPNQFSKLFTW